MICLSCAAMGAGLLWLFDAPLSLCIILFTQTLCIALRLLPSGRKHVFCYRIIVVLTGLCLLTWANVRNGQIVWERVSVWKMENIAAKHIVTMVPFCGDSSHTLPGMHFFSTSRVLENTAVMHGWGASLLCLAVCLMMITGMKLFVRMKHDKQWNLLSEAAILYFVIQTIGATAVFLGLMPDLDFMLPLFNGGCTIPIGLMAIVFFPKLFSKDSSGSHRFTRQNQSISK